MVTHCDLFSVEIEMLKLLLQQQKIKRKKFPNPAENPLDNPPGPAGRVIINAGDLIFHSSLAMDI